jgi:hypothetical protein
MTSRFLATALAAGLSTAPAAADDFTILIYEPARELALRSDTGPAGQAYWAAYAAYAGELAKAGAVRGGAALATSPDAAPPRLSGFFLISAPTRAQAEALAAAAPANRRGGRAEVRDQLPAMAAGR